MVMKTVLSHDKSDDEVVNDDHDDDLKDERNRTVSPRKKVITPNPKP